MEEDWVSLFILPYENELPELVDWLEERLKRDLHTYEKHEKPPRIVIHSKTKDDAFKVGEWIRHKNNLGRVLNYSVLGFKEGRIIWASWCSLCREGARTPHFTHRAVAA